MEELTFAFGGAVKATGSTIEGLLVPYGNAGDVDADGEFFDASTDLGLRLPASIKLFYHHGLNERLGRVPIAWAALERREDGVWFKSDFDEDLEEWEAEERTKAQRYRAHVLKLARDGQLGASSGAAAHVVVRRPAGKAVRIARWPLGEASVTPTPSNARTVGTVSLKALTDLPDPLEELDGEGCGECQARSLAQQTEAVVEAVKALTADYGRLAAKDGRVLSTSRRARLQELYDTLGLFLAETAPRPRDVAAPTDTDAITLPVTGAPPPAAGADQADALPPISPLLWPATVGTEWLGAP